MKKDTTDLENFLDAKKRMQFKLEHSLESVHNRGVALVIIEGIGYQDTNAELVSYFEHHQMKGIFVSVNKPLVDLFGQKPQTDFVKKNVDFVDCISELSGARELAEKHYHYLESPQQLVELSMLLKKLMSKHAGPRFVVLDSLSTLLIYNKPEAIEKFVHAIANKMRSEKVLGVLVMIKTEENLDVIKIVSQFCDHIIEISDKSIGAK